MPPPIPPEIFVGVEKSPLQKATRPVGENQIVLDESRLPCGYRNDGATPLPRFLLCNPPPEQMGGSPSGEGAVPP